MSKIDIFLCLALFNFSIPISFLLIYEFGKEGVLAFMLVFNIILIIFSKETICQKK